MEFSKEMTFENYLRKHTVQVLKSLSMELSLLFFPDFMIVASDRVTWGFNVSGASRAVALDISKAFA